MVRIGCVFLLLGAWIILHAAEPHDMFAEWLAKTPAQQALSSEREFSQRSARQAGDVWTIAYLDVLVMLSPPAEFNRRRS